MLSFCFGFVSFCVICLTALIASDAICTFCSFALNYARNKLMTFGRFSYNLKKNKGQLLRIKNGIVWWDPSIDYDRDEKICFLIDFCHKRDLKKAFKEKNGSITNGGSVVNSLDSKSKVQWLDCGGDYCLQIMIDGKIIWVESGENGIEFL